KFSRTHQKCGREGSRAYPRRILSVKREYTLDGMPVHCRAPCIPTFTPRGKLSSIHLLACFWEMGENRRTWRKPTWTRGEHTKRLHTERHLSSGLNTEATTLAAAPPAVPLCRQLRDVLL
ncbi:hypothetical protein PGIGA_G00122280, partial [Pangasianodon gigas]|nr:hypothetical protein [Pangasianodon gigas]